MQSKTGQAKDSNKTGKEQEEFYKLESPSGGGLVNKEIKAINKISVEAYADKAGSKNTKLSLFLRIDGENYLLNTWDLINSPQYYSHYSSRNPSTLSRDPEVSQYKIWTKEDLEDL